jgi:hypothetical protein
LFNFNSFYNAQPIIFRVSSASWYIINLFGLNSMYKLVLGENNAADQTKAMQDQMSGAALASSFYKLISYKL